MDVSDFSNVEFSATDWVNKIFTDKSADQQSKEATVTSLVSKLQLYVQQVNEKIEDTSQEILYSLPSIMKDVQNLQGQAVTLKSSISEVEREIAAVQEETSSGIDRLEYLDNLKTQLQIAKQGLQESDSWGALTTELEDLLERNDITTACDKLMALQQSLIAQKSLPGQVERTQQVEDFKNRLEALASIPVVQSFTSGNLDDAKKYVKIFDSMDRSKQLKHYYRSVQKSNLQRQWAEILELAENSNSDRFLRDFYDLLLENCQKQAKWCNSVFSDPDQAVYTISELLVSLQPSRETAIQAALKRSNEKLQVLREVSAANVHFSQMLQSQLEGKSILQEPSLSKAIFGYFSSFMGQYLDLEQNTLAQNVANLSLTHNSSSANAKVIFWMDEAIKRCEEITQNCAIGTLVTILNDIFKAYLEKYRKAQKQIEISRSNQLEQQDWSSLQICISLMKLVGELKLHLEDIENKIESAVLALDEDLTANRTFRYQITTKREEKDFRRLLQVIKENNKRSLFPSVLENLQPLCGEIHDTLLAIIFAPIEGHLKQVSTQDLFNQSNATSDLPDYSFVPLEYITLIGQYILTLPQHLEPLLISQSDALKTSLELSDTKYGKDANSADILLSLIADECCALYQEQISALTILSKSGVKQLATDIEYLGSVFEELGLSLGTNLQQTVTLLRAPSDKYLQISAGMDIRLVTKIKQIREIATIE
ncbi:conserved oligomeric Golgi complex subunit 7-like [Culicoides brevitarsis]|uniref:conserved oligomeric Golgi complex subunit 7-like n=1 Tax=Culicoides brevitarsis TaxID=469753 RepID=UPI00307B6A79